MRYQPLIHVVVIATFVLYFLFLLSGVLKTLLEDILPYALSRQELAVPSSSPAAENGTELIPKIIHQVYLGFDNKEMPQAWQDASQTCRDMHPDYEHVLWTNEMSRDLLRTTYPWFLKTYDNYRYPIQRADSIRYFILAHHGGIYLDLDNGCGRDLAPLLAFPAWMPATKIHVGLTNHVMGARKHHPYFELLTDRLQAFDYNWLLPYMTIMNSAGPHFVSMVWQEYLQTGPRQGDEVRILMQEEYLGNEWSFFTKVAGGTWNHWDTAAFKWVGEHLVGVVLACLFALCAAASCVWWAAMKLAAPSSSSSLSATVAWAGQHGVGRSNSIPTLPLWQKSD